MASKVTVTINKNVMKDITKEQAGRLISAAEYFAKVHSQRLSVPNPAPHVNSSRPGEYPRSRTGKLARSVTYWPSRVQEVAKKLEISLGYLPEAFYGGILEKKMRRLGLQRTMTDIARQIASFMGFKSRVS